MQCTAVVIAKSTGAPRVKIAVRDECAVTGNSKLSTVRVPGHDQVRAVFGHRVQYAKVRRVGYCEGEISARIESAGDVVVLVSSDVGIIDTANIDLAAIGLETRLGIRQIEPAASGETGNQVLPGKHRAIRLQTRRSLQIARRVDRLGGVVVVTAKNERAGNVEQRLEGVDYLGNRIFVRKEITGGDHRIGLQFAQARHPLLLLRLPGD